jgi:hypothetical protein
MMGSLMENELEGTWKKASAAPGICLEGLTKTMKIPSRAEM